MKDPYAKRAKLKDIIYYGGINILSIGTSCRP